MFKHLLLKKESINLKRKKQIKLKKIENLIDPNMKYVKTLFHLNFLNHSLKEKYKIIDTKNVSTNQYDEIAKGIINRYQNGLILDCGSGKRSEYLENVINYEIVPYDTTDVLGVGEVLPFLDSVFDGVLSLNVLEHVKDPFQCAREIVRVLKPGGELYCVVPFLQPVHGYPNHFYNMTSQGLQNLFEEGIEIKEQSVIASGLPIWTLSWMLNSWASGLSRKTRDQFINLTVKDLMENPLNLLNENFVKELSIEKNFELASTTILIGRKKI